jgi:cell division septation protein DedD
VALLVALVLVFLYRAGSFEAVKAFVADRLTDARPAETTAVPVALQNPPAEPEVQLAAVTFDSVEATLTAIPATAPPTVPATVPSSGTGVVPEGRYFIHVNSFLTQDRAETDVEHWAGTGMPAFFRTAEIRGKSWFRVYLGPFPTQEAADAQARGLKDTGAISYFMITRLAAGPDI